jgi:hypothetical protein
MDARKYVGESFIKVKDVLDCDLHMHAKSKEFYDIAVRLMARKQWVRLVAS